MLSLKSQYRSISFGELTIWKTNLISGKFLINYFDINISTQCHDFQKEIIRLDYQFISGVIPKYVSENMINLYEYSEDHVNRRIKQINDRDLIIYYNDIGLWTRSVDYECRYH